MKRKNREKFYQFRVTPEEHRDITKAAGVLHMTVSEFVRQSILEKMRRLTDKEEAA